MTLAELTLFGGLHWAVLAVWAALTVGVIGLQRWVSRGAGGLDSVGSRRLRYGFAGFGAGVWLFSTVYWLHPANIEVKTSLPFHVCDWTMLLLPAALVLRRRWMLTLVYFAGLGLTSWGLVIPVERAGPGETAFWVFWLGHGVVVTGALYMVFGLGYRARWRDLRFALLVGVVYSVAMFCLNVASGVRFGGEGVVFEAGLAWNYGYLGPGDVPVVGGLAWPGRVLLVMLAAAVAMVACWVPFRVMAWGRDRHGAEGGG